MEALNDIANRARVLLQEWPDDAKRLREASESLELSRRFGDGTRSISLRKEVRSWENVCREGRRLTNALAILCRQHLPELRLQFVRVNPSWRYDDDTLDWTPILAELRLVEDEAITKLRLATPKTPVVRDAATVARGKWLYEQCCKTSPAVVTYSTIITKLAKKPATWLRIESVNGIKKAATEYAKWHNLSPIPQRQPGRIAGK